MKKSRALYISVERNIIFIYGSLSDWDQEGMICLHELISREEGLVEDIPSFKEIFQNQVPKSNFRLSP